MKKGLYVLKNDDKKVVGCSTPNCDGSGNTRIHMKNHTSIKYCPLVNKIEYFLLCPSSKYLDGRLSCRYQVYYKLFKDFF